MSGTFINIDGNGTGGGGGNITPVATNQLLVTTSSLSPLPSYSYSNGAAGQGATVTANANGVAPTMDGITPVVGKSFLLQNGFSPTDNGPYQWVSIGSTGTPWSAVRVPGCDTATTMLGSRITLSQGATRAGRTYFFNNPNIPTIGTTGLFWIPVGRIPTDQGFDLYEDFYYAANLAVSATSGIGANGWLSSVAGTGTTVTVTAANNTDTVLGTAVVSTGSTNSGVAGCYTGWGNAGLSNTNSYYYLKYKVMYPTLSDGTNTYDGYSGMWDSGPAGTNSIFWYLNSNIDSHFKFGSSSASVIAPLTTTTVVAVAGQYYNLEAWKFAGESTWHFAIDGVEQGTIVSTYIPTAFVTGANACIQVKKSAGVTPRTGVCDSAEFRVFNPLGRGA